MFHDPVRDLCILYDEDLGALALFDHFVFRYCLTEFQFHPGIRQDLLLDRDTVMVAIGNDHFHCTIPFLLSVPDNRHRPG